MSFSHFLITKYLWVLRKREYEKKELEQYWKLWLCSILPFKSLTPWMFPFAFLVAIIFSFAWVGFCFPQDFIKNSFYFLLLQSKQGSIFLLTLPLSTLCLAFLKEKKTKWEVDVQTEKMLMISLTLKHETQVRALLGVCTFVLAFMCICMGRQMD